MAGHILFLTGELAEARLRRILDSMAPLDAQATVANIGVKVAALMTGEIIRRRLHDLHGADRVMVPGRFRGNLDALSTHFGVPFERGPEDLIDLPQHFGRKAKGLDLSRHDVSIFAEIIDAPRLDVAGIVARARGLKADGADVIDLGCLPDQPFAHLEEAVRALRAEGFTVSIDSADPDELRRGARAGATYLLSLTEHTLDVLEDTDAMPVLIPAPHGDLPSLYRAIEQARSRNRRCLADPILDPIHFGFTESLVRYRDLRRHFPDVEILMGIGNVTELTDADTPGINAMLMGVISELRIGHVLAVQVSPHCRTAVREFDAARRLFFAAREAGSLPQGFGDALLCLRDRRPYSVTPADIADWAAQVRDANYRIEVAEDGIHLFSRDLHHVGHDPFALFGHLRQGLEPGHIFYLGVELARAQIAWQIGKRHAQDNELRWGVAARQENNGQ